MKTRSYTEADGYDETILPMDFKTSGQIIDDEINSYIVNPLPTGARLHAIVDACHSGTLLLRIIITTCYYAAAGAIVCEQIMQYASQTNIEWKIFPQSLFIYLR